MKKQILLIFSVFISSPLLAIVSPLNIKPTYNPYTGRQDMITEYTTSYPLGATFGGTGISSYTVGDMFYANSTYTLTYIPPPTSTQLKFLSGFGNGSAFSGYSWQVPPSLGEYTYFASTTASDVSGAEEMHTQTTAAIASHTVTSVSAAVIVSTWITPVSHPNLTQIPAGIWDIHFDATKTSLVGTKNLFFYAIIYKFDGSTYTPLFTTQNSEFVVTTSTLAPQELDIEVSTGDITLALTDRLAMVVYANSSGTGTDPSGGLWYQGATLSRLQLPSQVVSANNFVPYDGAVKDLNMGENTIKSKNRMNFSLGQSSNGWTNDYWPIGIAPYDIWITSINVAAIGTDPMSMNFQLSVSTSVNAGSSYTNIFSSTRTVTQDRCGFSVFSSSAVSQNNFIVHRSCAPTTGMPQGVAGWIEYIPQ